MDVVFLLWVLSVCVLGLPRIGECLILRVRQCVRVGWGTKTVCVRVDGPLLPRGKGFRVHALPLPWCSNTFFHLRLVRDRHREKMEQVNSFLYNNHVPDDLMVRLPLLAWTAPRCLHCNLCRTWSPLRCCCGVGHPLCFALTWPL